MPLLVLVFSCVHFVYICLISVEPFIVKTSLGIADDITPKPTIHLPLSKNRTDLKSRHHSLGTSNYPIQHLPWVPQSHQCEAA